MSETPTPRQALRSPLSPPLLRRDSVTSEQAARPVNTQMLRIKNLLNPMDPNKQADASASLRATPAYTVNDYTPTPTPGPDTPLIPASAKRQKNGKGKAVAQPAATKGLVRYRSYECNSDIVCPDPTLRNEIIIEHHRFQVSAGEDIDGLISDFARNIPYASSKKDFHEKTGREGFECWLPGVSHSDSNGIPLLTCDSLSVYLQCPRRQEQKVPHGHVGLPGRPCAYHILLQGVRRFLKGIPSRFLG